jgi:hypothetical protein
MFHRAQSSQKTEKSLQEGFGFSCGKPVVKIEPSRLYNISRFDSRDSFGTVGVETLKMESLILAQDERWRRA